MAITLRGATTASTGSSTSTASYTIAKPSGVVNGDALLIYVVIRGTNAASTPAGFSAVTATTFSSTECQLFYRVADGTEGSTFTLSWTGANPSAAVCLAYAGVSGSIFDPAAPSASGAAGTTNGIPTASSITTTVNGDTLVWFAVTKTSASGGTPGTISPPAGFSTEAAQISTTVASAAPNVAAYAADMTQPAAGATGTLAGTNTSGTDRADALVIALLAGAPASTAPTDLVLVAQDAVSGGAGNPGVVVTGAGASVPSLVKNPCSRILAPPSSPSSPPPSDLILIASEGPSPDAVLPPAGASQGPASQPLPSRILTPPVPPPAPGNLILTPGNPVPAYVLPAAGASPNPYRGPVPAVRPAAAPQPAPPPPALILTGPGQSPRWITGPAGASAAVPLSPRSHIIPAVRPLPVASPEFRFGTPRQEWETGVPAVRWAAGTPVAG